MIAGRARLSQRVDGVDDGAQGVANLVREARGHAPEIGQPLGRRDLLLHLTALRDVVRNALDVGDVA